MQLARITSVYRSKFIQEAYKKWLKKGNTVLDVGCGSGIVGKELENTLNIAVVGCDIDNYLFVDLPFVKMKNEKTLPQKKEYDACMFNDMLHHTDYENQVELLSQALRISKKVLIFDTQPTLLGKIFDLVVNKIHNRHMYVPYTFRAQEEWTTLFKKLNLKVQVFTYQRPLLYPFSHVAFLIEKKK